MRKGGWVYILTNKNHTVLYTGVTANLIGRILLHRQQEFKSSFTVRYNVEKLVYYYLYDSIEEAIAEEKKLKVETGSQKLN